MISAAEFAVSFTSSAAELLQTASTYLKAQPTSTNVINTICAQILSGELNSDPSNTVFATLFSNSAPVGVFMMMGRTIGVITAMPTGAPTALANALHARNQAPSTDLTGVDGNVAACKEFCKRWSELTGRPHKILLQDTVMLVDREGFDDACRNVKFNGGVDESWTDEKLVEVVAMFVVDFQTEAIPGEKASVPNKQRLLKQLSEKKVVVWFSDGDGEAERTPVAYCNWRTAFEKGGIARIGPVYTPLEHRGKGYATGVVAEGTRRALEIGGAGSVMLFVENNNGAARRVYGKLGYKEVDQDVWMRFE
ncbi:hypothetical protein BJ742DRAFT_72053 [Cladochytrium replicatum]|nr:hypothetical protein BJ742DRAFT_72053 [Cladochytrium replicatum]